MDDRQLPGQRGVVEGHARDRARRGIDARYFEVQRRRLGSVDQVAADEELVARVAHRRELGRGRGEHRRRHRRGPPSHLVVTVTPDPRPPRRARR